MQITDVKIRKIFDEGPMKAVVSITFDNMLALHDVKVINARDKFFVVMPSRKNPDGTYRDIVHPINSAMRITLEDTVIGAYFKYLKDIEDGVIPHPNSYKDEYIEAFAD
ncbi:MAG: septation regulator SpoVG [Ruminococcaceae bacterium]|nr:septation regulator SpoVG [Oscillospiraceae bacterium]